MLTPTELVVLLKGQAFEPLEGGQLWKLRMSLPDTRGDLANEMERPISPTASGSACKSRGGCPWPTFWHRASQWKILTAETVVDPRRTAVRQGLFTKGLATVSLAILWLLFSLLFSIIVEWVGCYFSGRNKASTTVARCLPKRSAIWIVTFAVAS